MTSNGIKTDPNTIPHDAWIDDVKQWPEVDDGKLLSYILRTKAVDVEYIGKYKDQKAYSYWMSGFVDTVLFTKCPIDSKHVFVAAFADTPNRCRIIRLGKSNPC